MAEHRNTPAAETGELESGRSLIFWAEICCQGNKFHCLIPLGILYIPRHDFLCNFMLRVSVLQLPDIESINFDPLQVIDLKLFAGEKIQS